jgi:Domain of unknown function (DUF5060)/Protein of unknown function (DUF4038)/Domain of unknown function (DUF5605)
MSQSVVSSRLATAIRCNIVVLILATFTLADFRQQANGSEPVKSAAAFHAASVEQREQWGFCEVSLLGPESGNPFVDVELSATFQQGDTKHTVRGFYDGDGNYRIRFMPDTVGGWSYTTKSNVADLDGRSGHIDVGKPSKGNHGPVRVCNTFHFAYADGTPYKPLGTTCYAWTSQTEALETQTLKTLAGSPFNKLRMCVFPKWYTWNKNEPLRYAFEGTHPNRWDFTRFNPAFFQHFERRIAQLRDLGIEADIIILHPYDEGHWGFDRMPAEADDRYVRYLVSRLAAFRNVWWSLANEYDFMKEKRESDWDRLIRVVHESDPYGRLTSIHNGRELYNHTNPLLTHASIQNGSAAEEASRAVLYRDVYRKPIVFDEIKYEGNIPLRWGNLSAEEMVHRFWECIIAGTYPGHGECLLDPSDVLWWSKGGVLRGESPTRIGFLRDILASAPAEGIEPIDKWQCPNVGGKPGDYYLVYFGAKSPLKWKFQLPRHKRDDPRELPGGAKFHVDVLDTWNMKVMPVDRVFTVRRPDEKDYVVVDEDARSIDVPDKPWMALRITRVKD